jgi:hypothetical protein
MTRTLTRQSYLELGAYPSAVPCARLHARNVRYEWSVRSIADTVELIVSELVTNAVTASSGYLTSPYVRLRLRAERITYWYKSGIPTHSCRSSNHTTSTPKAVVGWRSWPCSVPAGEPSHSHSAARSSGR